jgi:hypothetical protein
MKRIILYLLFVVLLSGGSTYSQDVGTPQRPVEIEQKGLGLGIIIGEPTGPCFKYWLSDKSAVDGAIAWSFDKRGSLHLHADYLLHCFSFIDVEKGRLPFYYGIGGRVKFGHLDNDDRLGVRIPIGLEYLFSDAPPGVFIEIVPILDLIPDTEIDYNAAIGIRYYF